MTFLGFLGVSCKAFVSWKATVKKMELQKATECDISIPPFLNSASDLLWKSIRLWWIPQRNKNKPRKAPLAENLAAASAALSSLQFTASRNIKYAQIHNIFYAKKPEFGHNFNLQVRLSFQKCRVHAGIKLHIFLVYHKFVRNFHKRNKCVETCERAAFRLPIKLFALFLLWTTIMSDFELYSFCNWVLDTNLYRKN